MPLLNFLLSGSGCDSGSVKKLPGSYCFLSIECLVEESLQNTIYLHTISQCPSVEENTWHSLFAYIIGNELFIALNNIQMYDLNNMPLVV